MIDNQPRFASMVYKSFDKKTAGGTATLSKWLLLKMKISQTKN